MGQSVLTPEEILLGKAFRAAKTAFGLFWRFNGQWGKGNSVQHSETRLWGLEAAKQLTTGGHRVVEPEESFLFSLTTLTPRITFQLEKGV